MYITILFSSKIKVYYGTSQISFHLIKVCLGKKKLKLHDPFSLWYCVVSVQMELLTLKTPTNILGLHVFQSLAGFSYPE